MTTNAVSIGVTGLTDVQVSVSAQAAASESIFGSDVFTNTATAISRAVGISGVASLTGIELTVSATSTLATSRNVELNASGAIGGASGLGPIASLSGIDNSVTTGSAGALTIRNESREARETVRRAYVGVEANIANFSDLELLVTTLGTGTYSVSDGEITRLARLAIGVTVGILSIANFAYGDIQGAIAAERATPLNLSDDTIAGKLLLVDYHSWVGTGKAVGSTPRILVDIANLTDEVIDYTVTAIGTSHGSLRDGPDRASTVRSTGRVALIALLSSI